MTRIVDDLLSLETPPGEPTVEEVQALFGREIAEVLEATEDTDDGYNKLAPKIQRLSAETKIKILETFLDEEHPRHVKFHVHYLRAAVALAQGTENNVVRADEATFKARVADVLLPELLAKLQAERARIAALPFRRTLD